ncbi:MAG: hypothetical protein IJT13_01475 [Bacteroidaceae bacterium]|nr:hypothetical protein [Bacteroidaceae bacterium]
MIRQGVKATSKNSLKLQCLFCAKGDLKEAKELYDFFASDMPELPDYDPVPPTWVDNTKEAVNGLMGWLKENQDTLAQGVDFFRGLIHNRTLPPTDTSPLPPINE